MKRIPEILTITALALALAACSPTITTRGNLVSATKFDLIKPNTSTRADVVQSWGPPTATSSFDPNVWYYIGETTAQKGVFAPEVEVRRMIRVKFDTNNNDTVTEVTDLDTTQAKNIDIVDRTTPTAGKEFTVLQQFIGNLGKYNTDSTAKR